MKVICKTCKKKFEKRNAEVNRAIKLGRNHFCSLSCSGVHSNKTVYKPAWGNTNGKGNRDQYTDFRWYMKTLSNNKRKPSVLTLADLKKLWDDQKGICPLTGVVLKLRTHSNCREPLDPYHASIDRIDNGKDYFIGNVRFIAVMANFARHRWSDSDLISFCKTVSENHKN